MKIGNFRMVIPTNQGYLSGFFGINDFFIKKLKSAFLTEKQRIEAHKLYKKYIILVILYNKTKNNVIYFSHTPHLTHLTQKTLAGFTFFNVNQSIFLCGLV